MDRLLLVGDNPFQGISHLSQERARSRGEVIQSPADRAAEVVLAALKNGANGFSFSVSDLTLSILRSLREKNDIDIEIYPMVPYAFEYVRIATQTGTPGLVKRFAKQVAVSGDVGAVLAGFWSVARVDPEGFMNTYLAYELSRIKSAAGRKAKMVSVMLNEVIGDMGLALDLDWLFLSFIKYLSTRGITPGFNTRNFPFLVRKFTEWGINLDKILIVTPLNEAGFQMNPSRQACEDTLNSLKSPNVIAISVFAAGYIKPPQTLAYLNTLRNLRGVLAGVSSQKQAVETFGLFKNNLVYNKGKLQKPLIV
ncbi:MAG: hypothetical protein NWE93_10700 [Candidatus Bathyarchaeota archaeon]|nr:hypothetical protein [Candidatus Bathyarchaeota archaeon]